MHDGNGSRGSTKAIFEFPVRRKCLGEQTRESVPSIFPEIDLQKFPTDSNYHEANSRAVNVTANVTSVQRQIADKSAYKFFRGNAYGDEIVRPPLSRSRRRKNKKTHRV